MSKIAIGCTRRIEFDAAHRVVDHESKCKNLHGHRYGIEATFEAASLDTLGRVIDFGEIRSVLGAWVDENWDHTTILWEKDRELGEVIAAKTGQRIFYMPTNPTAENMAEYLLQQIIPMLFKGKLVNCTRVLLQETPNCSVTASLT